MRKLLFTALVLLCISFPGKAVQTDLNTPNTVLSQPGNSISDALVEQILRYVGQEFDLEYGCLCDWYDNGLVTIEKSGSNYLVTISTKEGGGSLILLDEIF